MYKTILPILLSTLLGTALYSSTHSTNTIISDKKQHIYWQDTALPKKKNTKDWDDANTYCERLSLHGMENWRVPTFTELLSIVNYTQADPAIDAVFTHVGEGTYWTSTDFSSTRSRAWTIDFRTGKTYYSYKSTNHAVRCVVDFPTDIEDQK